MTRPPGLAGIGDEIERIGAARVLGARGVVEIGPARQRIDDDVLEHRAEAFGRRVDLGLCLAAEADGLGVAAALEVEDPVWRPPVLVVTEQGAGRIGRQGGLAGP